MKKFAIAIAIIIAIALAIPFGIRGWNYYSLENAGNGYIGDHLYALIDEDIEVGKSGPQRVVALVHTDGRETVTLGETKVLDRQLNMWLPIDPETEILRARSICVDVLSDPAYQGTATLGGGRNQVDDGLGVSVPDPTI